MFKKLFKKLFFKEWTPESNTYCCIVCGREHSNIIKITDELGWVYTLNFCSVKCANKFSEKHSATYKDGNYFLAPHHREEFYNLWMMRFKSPKKFETYIKNQDKKNKKKGYTKPNKLYSHKI
ncbi:MAG: hypothetical protein PHU51_02180 [Candidatus Nanoarchaeia archaeon]|nr:hypothetical protein [Candidatus Nanoarchaeia archaeon]